MSLSVLCCSWHQLSSLGLVKYSPRLYSTLFPLLQPFLKAQECFLPLVLYIISTYVLHGQCTWLSLIKHANVEGSISQMILKLSPINSQIHKRHSTALCTVVCSTSGSTEHHISNLYIYVVLLLWSCHDLQCSYRFLYHLSSLNTFFDRNSEMAGGI